MANILDYLDWFGDVPFDTMGFNEVDNVILAQLAYCNLENVVPTVEDGGWISMAETARRFVELNGKDQIYGWAGVVSPYTVLLPQKMAASRRFGGARLGRLFSRLDAASSEQLCVFHVKLPDGSTYVSFRGTDDTVTGWREDFEMTYRTVPSQVDALGYIEETCRDIEGPIMLGGHSKGGNVAVFAASLCTDEVRDKISVVWNDDGPGFDPEVLPPEAIDRIRDRLRTYVPQFDIVAQLLSVSEPTKIVVSDEEGVMAHSALSWQVLGPRFVAAVPQELSATAVNHAFDLWLGSADHDKRRHVFTEFFDLLGRAGVGTLSDLMSGDPAIVAGVTAQIASADLETREYLLDLVTALTSNFVQRQVSAAAHATTQTVKSLLDGEHPLINEETPLDLDEMNRYQRYVARRRTLRNVVRWLGLDRWPVRAALAGAAGAVVALVVRKRLRG